MKSEPVTIEQPTKDDIPTMLDIFTISFTDALSKEGVNVSDTNELEEAITYQKELFEDNFADHNHEVFLLIAKTEDKIVGIGAHKPPSSLITDNFETPDGVPEVGSVYILPEYQNKGIGTQLFDGIIAELKRKGVPTFVLDSGFARAKPIWQKKLGLPTKVLKDHWGPGADHFIWHCNI